MLLTRHVPLAMLRRSLRPRTPPRRGQATKASGHTRRSASTSRASPLEETETVKTINKLLSQVRTRNRPSASSSGSSVASRLPTRINTQTWIEYAKSQQAVEKSAAGETGREQLLQQVEEMLSRPKRMHDR